MASDIVDGLRHALAERDLYLLSVGGCGDGSCIVVRPKGMHTNGGCRCNQDKNKMTRIAYANNKFATQVREIYKRGES